MVTSSVNLGTAFADKVVRIRFRIGTDEAAGGFGWFIDDIAFTGLANTPFTALVDEQGVCTTGHVDAQAGEDLAVDELSVVQLQGSGSSLAGGALTYRWEQVAGPFAAMSGADTATPSFTAPEVLADTMLTFRLTVLDGGLRDRDTVQVLVRQVNKAPAVSAGTAQTVDEGSTVTLQGSAEDPDGDAVVSQQWTQVSGLPVTLTGADTLTPSFTAPAVAKGSAELVFQLVVSDGQLSGEAATVSVTVRHVPLAPTVSAGDDVATFSAKSVTLTATATDPEQGTLTYAWSQSEGPTVTLQNATQARVQFTAPEVSAATEFVFVVKVSSESGLSAEDRVTVTVSPAPPAPKESSGCSSTGTTAALPLAMALLSLLAWRRRED